MWNKNSMIILYESHVFVLFKCYEINILKENFKCLFEIVECLDIWSLFNKD